MVARTRSIRNDLPHEVLPSHTTMNAVSNLSVSMPDTETGDKFASAMSKIAAIPAAEKLLRRFFLLCKKLVSTSKRVQMELATLGTARTWNIIGLFRKWRSNLRPFCIPTVLQLRILNYYG